MNENGKKRREWVKTAAIIFLSVMLVLTFFSNTIMNYSLPEVATQYVESGTITAKIRGIGRNPQLPVAVTALGEGYRVDFTDEAWAPAVGQPLVLYRGGRVIGGGIITNF